MLKIYIFQKILKKKLNITNPKLNDSIVTNDKSNKKESNDNQYINYLKNYVKNNLSIYP